RVAVAAGGDGAQAEHGVDLAEVGVVGDGVVGVVQLVVVAQRGVPVGQVSDDRVDLGAHGRDQRRRLGQVAGGRAELFELGVGVVEGAGGGQDQRLDARSPQTRHQVAGVGVGDDQVGVVAEHGLHVRGVAG